MEKTTKSNTEVSERTKQARKAAGLTQSETADALGMGRVTYTRYENGFVLPQWRLQKFCEITGINLDWLLSGTLPKDKKDKEKIEKAYERLRALNEQQQKAVEAMIDAFLDSKGS